MLLIICWIPGILGIFAWRKEIKYRNRNRSRVDRIMFSIFRVLTSIFFLIPVAFIILMLFEPNAGFLLMAIHLYLFFVGGGYFLFSVYYYISLNGIENQVGGQIE